MLRKLVLALVATAVLAAGCGSTATHHHSAPATTRLSFTNSEGAGICNDLNAWLLVAFKQDMPRFSATMRADESEASGTTIGTDLQTLDTDTQTENGLAFFPPGPGQPSDVNVLQQDCAAYGVKVYRPGYPPLS
jgi:uncharacterized protein YceK